MTRIIHGLRYGFREIWADIALWFFVGLFLAGIITVYMPESLSQMILGGGIVAMLAMLLMGMPIYICATASTPIAAAFLLKGASIRMVCVEAVYRKQKLPNRTPLSGNQNPERMC